MRNTASTSKYHGETVINHGGATNGFGCNMMYLPRLKFGIVVFGNSNATYTPNEKISWSLVDEFLGIPLEKRYDWDAAGREELAKEHLDTVEELYPQLAGDRLPLTFVLGELCWRIHSRRVWDPDDQAQRWKT
jgi:hypothetical protein